MDAYVCDRLSITPFELSRLGHYAAQVHLGYHEGKALAEWAEKHPFGEKDDNA